MWQVFFFFIFFFKKLLKEKRVERVRFKRRKEKKTFLLCFFRDVGIFVFWLWDRFIYTGDYLFWKMRIWQATPKTNTFEKF
jgi:hypothetical protein